MSGGQDWAASLIESTGHHPTEAERTAEGIRHCEERIRHFSRLRKLLKKTNQRGEDASKNKAEEIALPN